MFLVYTNCRYPVFIGIDDYNALYDYSSFEYRNEPYEWILYNNG